jgi:diguanylate cyclase (GGDEF)-like protein
VLKGFNQSDGRRMSLIRQIGLLLLATLALAFAASVTVNVSTAREALQTQLRLKNSDNTTALALVLSQQKGQLALMDLALAAQFDTGHYQSIQLLAPGGQVLLQRQAPAAVLKAPAWFVAEVPIESTPGVAQVSDGWQAVGAVHVVSQSVYAHDELWQASLRSAGALALVGVVAGLLAMLGVARIRRPLAAVVQQAASLERGEYVEVPEPQVPELQHLARAMNSMVVRLRSVFEAQAEQVEALRRQASCDALTGLSNRKHFMAQLAAALQREDGTAAGGLVLLRVLRLAEVNHTLGRESTDRLIAAIAQTLQAYTRRVDGAFVGRLNGADFALGLPAGGVAYETAQALTELLRAALPALAPHVAVAAGAVEMHHGAELAQLMGHADLALARAESNGPFAVESAGQSATPWAALGERGWRQLVSEALTQGRVQLGSFPVVNANYGLIHLECPLRLQLQPQGAFEVAAHWLPLAVRSRMTCAADERALSLALQAIAKDGQPRCVNVSPASLGDSGFSSRMRALLMAAPRASRGIWLEVSEDAAVDQFELVRELGRQLRPMGARWGLEHAGERLGQMERLLEAGLDYVKLDPAVTQGVASDLISAGFVKGLVGMLHSLGLQVYAEGVSEGVDAQVLWACGIDGITGPWVGAQPIADSHSATT